MGAFRFLTAGESHGPALGVTIEGVPAGLALTADDLAVDLARRQRGLRPRRAPGDRAGPRRDPRRRPARDDARVADPPPRPQQGLGELDAGHGRRAARRGRGATPSGRRPPTGNKRATPVTRVRPGHADLAGALKYDFNDVRNVLERASARETAARVAAGGVARAFLRELGIEAWSFTAEVGGVALDPANATRSREESEASPLRCPDPDAEAADGRPDRRGAVGRRHRRWRVRGRRPRPADRARVVRPLGPAARRRAGGRGHEHQHRQGRRVRTRLRADAPVRVGRPRRHRGPRPTAVAGSTARTTPAA